VLLEAGARHVQLRGFSKAMLLETKVRDVVAGGEALEHFMARVADASPTPGGGSVAAHVGALGAALAQMVAGLTIGKKKYAGVEDQMKQLTIEASTLRRQLSELVQRDADAYERVRAAYTMSKEPAHAVARADAVRDALLFASRVPLETAQLAVRVADIAATVAELGNSNAVTDACVAALMAEAACKGAVLNVRINVAALDQQGAPAGAQLTAEARACLDAAALHVGVAEAAAERAMVPS
jgi:glutamate formiminotransferase/formiminotetrahydrofolate cyclodeaminase